MRERDEHRGMEEESTEEDKDMVGEEASQVEDNNTDIAEKAWTWTEVIEEYDNEASQSITCQNDFCGYGVGIQTALSKVDALAISSNRKIPMN